MGAFLQIRVTAVTFDPGQVEKAWPRLVRLAYPVEATPPAQRPGVLELVETLMDKVRLDDLAVPDEFDPVPGIRAASDQAERLKAALAERDPQTADSLSYTLEESLWDLERGLS